MKPLHLEISSTMNNPGAVTCECRNLVLRLDAQGRAVSLRHRASNYEFLAASTHPVGLWQMGLIRPVTYTDPLPLIREPIASYEGHEWFANRNEYRADLEIDSDTAPAPVVQTNGNNTELTWSLPVPGGTATLCLTVTGGPEDRLEFHGRVALPDGWALKRLTFPRIRGLGDPAAAGDDALLFPETWGVLRRNPLEDMTCYSGQYPAHINWCQMTAWLHGDRGLYVGVLDPEANHTGIDMQYVEGGQPAPMETDPRCLYVDSPVPTVKPHAPLSTRLAAGVKPAFQLRCHHWPAMTSEWTCPYPVVLQGFSGDWYEAARIHRGWATKQRWCRRGRLADRKDASPALAGLDLWFIKYGFHPASMNPEPAETVRTAMHKLQDFFQIPFGLHWYHWHAFNWHRHFPGHTPAVEGFAEVVKDLQQRGIVVMPYCQGRLLYRDRVAFADERTHAAVGADSQPYMEKYTDQDDWPLALCPTDSWSRAQWFEAARMLWQEYGVDGVYFDQITAMPPSLCYHRGHGHPPGGGNQWWRGYDGALAATEPMIHENPRRFLSSELMADAYMDRIDLYLSFVPILEDFVPLHPAIYGGYTTVMGRATFGKAQEDLQLFVLCQGEQLLFGGQLGWVNEDILNHPKAANYLRELARLRSGLHEFLHYGTLEAPLEISQDARLQITVPAGMAGKPRPVVIDRPAVRDTVWRAPDGRLLLLLLNESGATAAVGIDWPPHWPRGDWTLWRLGADAPERVSVSTHASLHIPAFAVYALVSPDAAPTVD